MSSPERVPGDWPGREWGRGVEAAGLSWFVLQLPATAKKASGTLLLLHGTGGSAHSFVPLLPALHAALPSVHLVVPDLPGHGYTRGASLDALTLPRMAGDLATLVAALKLPALKGVAGHSAGAALALRMALDGLLPPDAAIAGFAPSLVAMPAFYMDFVAPLVNPFATSGPVASLIASFAGASGLIDRLLDSTGSRLPEAQRRPYRRLFADATHVRGSVGFMAAADLPALLADCARLANPCRFAIGEHDAWVPARSLKPVLHAQLPRAAVEAWPAGHLLHETAPERAAAFIAAGF
jgi:magnesium chelatase accessory protein